MNLIKLPIEQLERFVIYFVLVLLSLIFVLSEVMLWNTDSLHIILSGQSTYRYSILRILFYIIVLASLYILRDKFLKKLQASNCFNKTKLKIFSIYVLFSIFILAFYLSTRISNNIPVLKMEFGATLIVLLLGAIAVLLIGEDTSLNILIIGSTSVIAMLFLTQMYHFIDEYVHFLTAFNVSIGHITHTHDHAVVASVFESIKTDTNFKTIFSAYQIPVNYSDIVPLKNVRSAYPSDYFSVFYFPGAFGLMVGRLMHLSLASALFLGRFFNIITYVILSYFAIKLIPFAKNLFLVIMFSPYLILLSSSYSIDGIGAGFIILYAAYCFHLSYYDKKLTYRDYILIFSILLLAALFKDFAYSPIAILTLTIPLNNLIKNKKFLKILKIIIPILFVLMVVIFFYKFYTLPRGITDTRGQGYIDAAEQFQFIVKNPLAAAKIIFGYMFRAPINFGWLSAMLPDVFFGKGSYLQIPMILFIVYVAVTDINYGKYSFKATTKEKILLFIYSFSSFFLICIALYLTYNAVGTSKIQGVQARYLFPILPLFLLIFQSRNLKQNIKNYTMCVNFCSVLAIVFCQYTMIVA